MLATALTCLALNVFHESRGEPIEGQLAVAQVTMRRAKDRPNEICKVVYAPNQMSWTKEGKPEPKGKAWDDAKFIARIAMNHSMPDVTNGATHFHCYRVRPNWKGYQRTVKIGSHIFYKPAKVSHQ